MEHVWHTAAVWVGVAFLACLISIRLGLSVALMEIFLGFIAGNLGACFDSALFQTNTWINFLAGAEMEPDAFRRRLKPSLVIGSAIIPTIIAQIFFYPREVHLGVEKERSYTGSAENFLHTPEDLPPG